MTRRGVSKVRLESSWNAEGFYLRRGYNPEYPRTSDGTLLMRKVLPHVSIASPWSRVALLPWCDSDCDFALKVTEAAMRAHVERAFRSWARINSVGSSTSRIRYRRYAPSNRPKALRPPRLSGRENLTPRVEQSADHRDESPSPPAMSSLGEAGVVIHCWLTNCPV